MHRKSLLMAFVLASGMGSPAHAEMIAITNPSFESPATATLVASPPAGWSPTTISNGGYWNINQNPLGFWASNAPDGNQVAYLASASTPTIGSGIEQQLSAVLAPHTLYTLEGFVGHPIGFATEYQVSLLAGNTALATVSATGPQGTFAPFELTFDSTGSSLLGQHLKIRLFSTHAQTAFDNLSLQATTVPEPSSSLLLVIGMAVVVYVVRCRHGRTARISSH